MKKKICHVYVCIVIWRDKMYIFQDTDYNMSVKSTEFHSLQSEYDTLSSTLKQLTNQKDVAQKRLDDLDVQVRNMDKKGQILGGLAQQTILEWNGN